MSKSTRSVVYFIAGCLLQTVFLPCFACSFALAQLNENCTVTVLNRTVSVKPDGSWQLNNVPSNMGQVRLRVTCAEDGKTVSGQSEYVTIPANGNLSVNEIFFNNDYEQVPAALTINSEKSVLSTIGETTRLSVMAVYPDGSTLDVTSAGKGTTYTVSNPAIATISQNGIVTAISSGNIIVSASNEMVLSSLSLSVQLSGDSDGDGMPDDFELANGLNPNNPIDALEDMDGDGLTNLEEFGLGTGLRSSDTDGDGIADGEEVVAGENGYITNPLSGDSDGDGIWDGLEISVDSDPNDSSSFNLLDILDYIEVTPSNFPLVFNTIMTESTHQLAVTGTLIDGNTIDLTSTIFGTNYTSSDLTVANFGVTDGLVFAGQDGTAVITVTNNGFSAEAIVTVVTFAPIALSYVQLPSSAYANNVDVDGDYAYVAGGAGGLFVVDVSNPESPYIVTSLDTPGISIDIKASGNNAYIADGESGLRIINVSTPSAPFELGSIDTPGIAQDLVIQNNLAYIADGTSGLQVVDITDPANLTITGSVDTPGMAKGVDVEGNIAAVADGNTVQIIDIIDPTTPTIRGSVPISGNILDLVVRDNYAYVTAYNGGFHVVDFSVPTSPSIVANSPAIVPRDVALSDKFALFAEQLFPNVVAIYDVSDPENQIFRATINFSPLGDYAGTGIALTPEYVYFTSQSFVVRIDYGTTGNTRLFIGQYRIIQDTGTIAPSVSITAPLDGDDIIEKSTIQISTDATDDVRVASVSFRIDGEVVFTDTTAPYQFNYTVPIGINGFMVEATAIDLAGNVGTDEVMVSVLPDPPPTISIIEPTDCGIDVIGGSNLAITVDATDNTGVATVTFYANGQELLVDDTPPYKVNVTIPVGITEYEIEAVVEDLLGQTNTARCSLSVIPDPLTMVTGTIVDANGNPVAGATVIISDGISTTTGADGVFTFMGISTISGAIVISATVIIDGAVYKGVSLGVPAVLGGTTAVGTITVVEFLAEVKLTASDAAASTWFGYSVAISGDVAIVGVRGDDPYGSYGSAYIFVRNGAAWEEEAKLTASDAAAGDHFGQSVAISGDVAIVGAWRKNNFTGSAYIFVRNGGTWGEEAKLTASDPAAYDWFGRSVAISGGVAIVGAYGNDDFGNASGSAYIFMRNGVTWVEEAKLTASDADAGDRFGQSVAISGDLAIVGVPGNDDFGSASGSAYIFMRNGGKWVEEAKLTASDAAVSDEFGNFVTMSGGMAVVGAWRKNNFTGSAYIFMRNGGKWVEDARLTARDSATSTYFGNSVAISGDVAIIGARGVDRFSGAAYIFVRSGEAWVEKVKLTASDAAISDFFGISVAISGEMAIIGAHGNDDAGFGSGSAYINNLLHIISE